MKRKNFKHIISLGGNCLPHLVATRQGFRATPEQGELILPFDLAKHMYEAVCDIIESSFNDYCNPDFFEMSEDLFGLPIVKHTKYNMQFVHEIRGAKQKFFIDNNYAMLTALYKRRINNFYQYIKEGDILFVTHYREYPQRLNQVIKNTFPTLNYKIVALTTFIPSEFTVENFYPVENYADEIDYHCIPFPTDEYDWDWWKPESYESKIGIMFENRIGDILSKYVCRVNPLGASHQQG